MNIVDKYSWNILYSWMNERPKSSKDVCVDVPEKCKKLTKAYYQTYKSNGRLNSVVTGIMFDTKI